MTRLERIQKRISATYATRRNAKGRTALKMWRRGWVLAFRKELTTPKG